MSQDQADLDAAVASLGARIDTALRCSGSSVPEEHVGTIVTLATGALRCAVEAVASIAEATEDPRIGICATSIACNIIGQHMVQMQAAMTVSAVGRGITVRQVNLGSVQ